MPQSSFTGDDDNKKVSRWCRLLCLCRCSIQEPEVLPPPFFFLGSPNAGAGGKVNFVLPEMASVVRCYAGCWSEEHRAAVDRKIRVNDVAKNA